MNEKLTVDDFVLMNAAECHYDEKETTLYMYLYPKNATFSEVPDLGKWVVAKINNNEGDWKVLIKINYLDFTEEQIMKRFWRAAEQVLKLPQRIDAREYSHYCLIFYNRYGI